MTDEWIKTLQGAIPASDLLGESAFASRIIDVVCGCGERLGCVQDGAEEPLFNAWQVPLPVRIDKRGERLLSLRSGTLPRAEETIMLHCFKHGHSVISGSALRAAIVNYRRRGRRGRVVAQIHPR